MSMQLDQQHPPVAVTQHPYNSHAAHASIGPVIAVLLVIVVLGIIAGLIGRLCTGRKIMGYGQYDIESWIETKCSSCIDGRIYPPQTASNASATSVSPLTQHQPQQTTTAP
ncbi:Telomere maintenance component 1, putative isoform 1 [Hibiscus syriacus]|uniref:Telomere maintenance component 1, putative isoform 1 n=1 Tax=Hibiscus syriacus TaxID=106335 RepID=A0A6A3BL10_HIBSY|nr:Telomere maintenance component 1, putative isoform 1 [Hibiscus syriacus]